MLEWQVRILPRVWMLVGFSLIIMPFIYITTWNTLFLERLRSHP
jgi:hypothetical protein